MRNPLADNVYQMHNHELIGLAKNRFLDHETQVKIAKHPYRRAKHYLVDNAGLCTPARDILWNMGGYVFKGELISHGHFVKETSKYKELYDQYGDQMRSRSHWRFYNTFLLSFGWGHGTGYGPLPGPSATPPEILEDIYEKHISASSAEASYHSRWQHNRVVQALVDHLNTPTPVIVKISAAFPDDKIRSAALKRLGKIG